MIKRGSKIRVVKRDTAGGMDCQAFRYSDGVRPVWALKNLKKTDWLGKWSL